MNILYYFLYYNLYKNYGKLRQITIKKKHLGADYYGKSNPSKT
jgi:hypothetical protein